MTSSGVHPDVSIVIPTTGRRELARAIASVRNQHGNLTLQIIVVVDALESSLCALDSLEGVDAIIYTGGRTGGSNARNIGIEASQGDYVAMLDDDDVWMPQKLELQLNLIKQSGRPELCVVAGRHVHVDAQTGRRSAPGPRRLMEAGQSVSEYLFRRRSPHGGRASLYTSTLLCSRRLAQSVKWDTSLKRHQDWDWLVKLGGMDGVSVLQVDEAIAEIQTGSPGSISATQDWRSSLQWAITSLDDVAVRSDFLSAQTMRYALHARSREGVWQTLRAILETKRFPAPGPIIIGTAGLLSRRVVERATTASVGISRPAKSSSTGNV